MKREGFWAPLALAALFGVVLGPFLLGDRSVATHQDNTYLLLPIFSFASRALESGEAPYWVNSLMAGLPLYSTPQFSWTYPFYLLGMGLYGGPVEAIWHVHLVTFFHVGLLGLNTYAALRLLATSPTGASLGGALVMLSANTMRYTTWVNITAPYAWLPLVVAGGILAVGGPRRAFGALTLAGALGLLIRAAPSQALIHALFCLAVIGAFGLGRLLWRADYRGLLRSAGALGSGGVLALAIGAPAVVPAVLAAGGAIRFIGEFPPVVGWQPLPFGGVLVGQMEPKQLFAAVLPFDSGAVYVGDPYLGPAAIWLACVALAGARRRWFVLPLASLALYSVLSAAGSHLGLAQLNYHLPFMGQIREPGRHLAVFVLCGGLLAGLGFDVLRAHLAAGWRAFAREMPLTPMALGFALVGLAAVTRLPARFGGSETAALVWIAAMFGCLAVSLARAGWLRSVALGAAALCAAASGQQFAWIVPPVASGDYYAPQNLATHAVLRRLAALPDARQYRVLFEDGAFDTKFWSMNGTYHGLRTFQAYMNPLPFGQFNDVFYQPRRNYYPLLGAKYMICRPCTSPMVQEFQPAGTIDGYSWYVAERAQPRYALVRGIAGTYAGPNEFFDMIERGFDYRMSVALNRTDEPMVRAWLTGGADGPAGAITEVAASLNRIRLHVTGLAPAVLLLNEYATPDWHATIDGRPAPTWTVNLNQVGVLVPAGTSEVVLEYRPILFIWLRRLAFCAALGLAAGASMLWRRGRATQHRLSSIRQRK